MVHLSNSAATEYRAILLARTVVMRSQLRVLSSAGRESRHRNRTSAMTKA
jgi:hypothetical protein